jgi:hypothetical protein
MLASSTVCYKYLYISFCIYSFECRSALKNFRVFLCGTWWPFIWEWLSLKNNNLQIITKILIKHIRKNFLGLLIKHIKVSNALWLFLLAFFYKVSWLYMAEGKCFLTPPPPQEQGFNFCVLSPVLWLKFMTPLPQIYTINLFPVAQQGPIFCMCQTAKAQGTLGGLAIYEKISWPTPFPINNYISPPPRPTSPPLLNNERSLNL